MQQTLYIDVLFVVNFSMDFLALYLTSVFLHAEFIVVRKVIASIVGALYASVAIATNFTNLLVTLLVAVLICLISFGYTNLQMLLKRAISYFAVNFILGGAMTAIYNWFNKIQGTKKLLIYGEVNTIEEQLPMVVFVLSCCLVSIYILIFGRVMNSRKGAVYAKVDLKNKGKYISFKGVVDSANFLIEPLSGQPVIFVSKKIMEKLVSGQTLEFMESSKLQNRNLDTKKIRLVVMETVSGKEIAVCFKTDEICVDGVKVSAWLALGKNSGFSDFDGIVPLGLAQNPIKPLKQILHTEKTKF